MLGTPRSKACLHLKARRYKQNDSGIQTIKVPESLVLKLWFSENVFLKVQRESTQDLSLI